MSRILVILSLLVLVGCSRSLDIELEPEVNVFLSNNADQQLRLTSTDKEYNILNEWLETHGTGWYQTSGRYPGGVYVVSGKYGIQITETNVVLYSTTPPEPKAIFIQSIGKGELSEIRNLAN
ncbi:MAG: hypothetical protein KZQ93_17660 [Candidatus Thiodiazotropha sp. (ex Monitilora ramsayi)]|nr:hypothetical protein [Candidatus Thiodiazotropha sp. (ex Monitilora ramsayi)]